MLEFLVSRAKITIENIILKTIDEDIGYIRVRSFGEDTAEELEEAMEELLEKEVKAFILDLRNNGGGFVHTAVDISSNFLPEETLVVTVKDTGEVPLKYYAGGAIYDELLPLVVLVNEYSASASEITAGAIQDNQCGILLGSKTFGKGSVQTLYPIGTSGVLKITTAHYFTPLDRDIDQEGLEPDIELDMSQYFVGDLEKDIQIKEAVDYLLEKLENEE